MLLPWGCSSSGNIAGCCLKCTVLARRPTTASENTLGSALRLSKDPGAFCCQELQEHRGLLLGRRQGCGSHYSCSRHSSFSLASQPWCLGNPQKQQMFLFPPLLAHAFSGLGLWLFECDCIPLGLSRIFSLDSWCPSELVKFIPTVRIKQLRLGSQMDCSQLLQLLLLHTL